MIDEKTHNFDDCPFPVYYSEMTACELEYDVLEGDDQSISLLGGNTRGVIRITAKFKDISTCKKVIQMRMCTLHQSVVEYAVVLQNDIKSLQYSH